MIERVNLGGIFRLLAALAGLAIATATAASAQAASCLAASTVKSAASAFLSAARSGSPSAFSAALNRYTNVDSLAIFALGKYRADLPPARRDEYVRNTRYYMSQFLADHAGNFKGGTNIAVENCSGNLVTTSLDGGSQIVWRMSGDRIQDVKVSGIWLAQQLRQNFAGIIRQNHGYVSSLLDYLARRAGSDMSPGKKN
jgi:phospholipid transport system substrate-binding protein